MTLSPDFKEFVRLLNENNVRYLVVGGYAVALHGHPRYTKDLDVWVEAESRNVGHLLKALEEFGFGSLNLDADDFLEPETVVQLGRPPNRIDLVADIDGVTFETSFENRHEVAIDQVEVAFIGLDQLRENKRASGRHQDLADLENLEDEPE